MTRAGVTPVRGRGVSGGAPAELDDRIPRRLSVFGWGAGVSSKKDLGPGLALNAGNEFGGALSIQGDHDDSPHQAPQESGHPFGGVVFPQQQPVTLAQSP